MVYARALVTLGSGVLANTLDISTAEFERIPNFRTNRVPNMYSKIKSVRIEYRVITRSGKTIRIVFEYQKLLE